MARRSLLSSIRDRVFSVPAAQNGPAAGRYRAAARLVYAPVAVVYARSSPLDPRTAPLDPVQLAGISLGKSKSTRPRLMIEAQPGPAQLARGPAVAGDRSRPPAIGSDARNAATASADEVKSHVLHKQYGIFFYENPI